jgi:hypothetical protein
MTDRHPVPDTDPSPALWLGLSIASCLLCCLPLGVIGVIYAALGLGAQNRGDWVEASRKAHVARNWTIASAVVTLVLIAIAICAGGPRNF